MTGTLITPEELKRIADEQEMAKAREALEKKRKSEHERDQFHETFMSRDIHPEVFERLSRLVKGAAERGEREVLALRFPSSYCIDGGRAINSFEPDWPGTLTGFAKKGARVVREGARAAGLQGARADPGFSRWHAGRRRDLPAVVRCRPHSPECRGI